MKRSWIFYIVVLTTLFIVNPACAQTEEELLKRGSDNADADRFDNAISDFTKCISLFPKSSKCLFYRGGIYYLTNKYDLAIADYSQGISLDPKSFGGFYFRALAYESIEKYKEALADLRRALELKPNDADAEKALAKMKPLHAKQLYQEGYAISRRAYKLKEAADLTKAETLYREALGKYTSAIELAPAESEYYSERADAYEALGKLDLAITDLSEVMKLKPNMFAWLGRAELYIQRRMFDLAIKDLTKAIAFKETPILTRSSRYALRGRAYFGKGETKLALADFNQAIDMNGSNFSAYYYRGLTHVAMKNRQAAIDDFKFILNFKSKHKEAAEALKKLGVNP